MLCKRRPVMAYIDGGLAAFLVQAAIAGFLGALLVLKGYWYRVKAFFTGGSGPDGPGSAGDGEAKP